MSPKVGILRTMGEGVRVSGPLACLTVRPLLVLAPMTDPISPEVLARYLAGQATDAERRAVDAWAAADPAHDRELRRLQEAWHPAPPGRWNVDAAWLRVAPRLEARPRAVPLWRRPLALAAVLAVSAGAVLAWRAMRAPDWAAPVHEITAAGERRSVSLPDGTRIVLAPESDLRVGEGYGRDERRVDLSGEAWFEVSHDASRPFRVHAAGTVTEDLGTEFSVRALPGSGRVQVALVSGSASLMREGSARARAAVLGPGDVARLFDTDSLVIVQRGQRVDELTAWRDGRLVFRDAPLGEVAGELSRWYGIPFRLEDSSVASRRLDATFQMDQLDETVSILALALSGEAVVTRDSAAVVIRGP